MDDNILDEMDLPLSSSNEDIETISKNQLRPLFNVSRFEVRSEDLRDKGIDLHIELKKNNKYTNFRFVVQLKATDSKKVNADGTISLQIQRSNLNYLLNNPGPAYYILYFKNTDTFYFENLNDFVRKLAETNIDWKDQQSHVVRFKKILTKEAIDGIYSETLQKGIFHRKVNEKLIEQSASIFSTDRVLIDAELNVSDDAEIRYLVEKGGFILINEGRWKDLISLHKKGSQAIASTPKYNLLLGMAYYNVGHHVDALSFLKTAQKLKDQLPSELEVPLEYYLLSVRHSLGLCTDHEYLQRINEMEDADGLGLYIKLEKAKEAYYQNLSDKPEDKLKKLLHEIQTIIDHPTADNALKFISASELLLIKGSKNTWNYVTSISRINAMEAFTWPNKPMRLDAFQRFTNSYESWVQEVDQVRRETFNEKRYFHYFHTVLNEVKVIYEMAVLTSVISIQYSMPGMPELRIIDRQLLLNDLLEKVAKALNFYRHIGHIENEVVALSLRYELEHYLQEYAKSAGTISEIENLIDTYELADKKRRLQHLKNKGTTHEMFLSWINSVTAKAESDKQEYKKLVEEMKVMDAEDRKKSRPDVPYSHIHLFPIGYFQFPENATDTIYDILGIKSAQLKQHINDLLTFAIPILNIHYSEITEEGPRDGNLADKGIENWRNIYRIRKAFFENGFFRDDSIP